MPNLISDLQTPKENLEQFGSLAKRVLRHIPNVVSGYKDVKGYRIYTSNMAGTLKYVRPIKTNLFLFSDEEFGTLFSDFKKSLNLIKNGERNFNETDSENIDKVLYTIQQPSGIGLDLLSNPNSARKHVGNRFEELMRIVFSDVGLANKKIVLKIPYGKEKEVYSCEMDVIVSPHERVRSGSTSIDEAELVVSLKTSSKDRMGKNLY